MNLREDGEAKPTEEVEKSGQRDKRDTRRVRGCPAPKVGGLLKRSMADSIDGYGGEAGCGLRRDM